MKTVGLFLTLTLPSVFACAQTNGERSVRIRLTNLMDYVDMNVPKDTLDKWVQWVELGESPQGETSDRNEAWKSFLLSFYRHQQSVPNYLISEQILIYYSQFLTFPYLTGRVLDIRNMGNSSLEFDPIEITGNGTQYLAMIPPMGFSAAIFDDFKTRYRGKFKFLEVSYPYFGGAFRWEYPEKDDYVEAPWLSQVESEISTAIQQRNIDSLYVLAVGSGVYMALRLSVLFPGRIKGIISVDGQFRTYLADPNDGDLPSDLAYRRFVADRTFPTSLVMQFNPALIANNYSFTRNSLKNEEYLGEITSAQR